MVFAARLSLARRYFSAASAYCFDLRVRVSLRFSSPARRFAALQAGALLQRAPHALDKLVAIFLQLLRRLTTQKARVRKIQTPARETQPWPLPQATRAHIVEVLLLTR